MREVNERIRDVAATFGDASSYELLCECTRPDCLLRVSVAGEAYEEIRRSGGRFVVFPGHEAQEERVLARAGSFLVVGLRASPGTA